VFCNREENALLLTKNFAEIMRAEFSACSDIELVIEQNEK